MAFPKNGVVEAGKIVPSAFGLLAVIKPENSADEDRWVRGFSQEYETTVNNLKNWDDTDTTSYALVDDATVNYYDEIKPFFIEIDEVRSTLGFLGIDRISRLKRQLEGVTQKSLERELWNGDIRTAEGHDNKALVSEPTLVNSGVALSPKRALALLEHSIAGVSHGGEQGVIHATRDVIALLSSNSSMLFHETDKDHLQTFGGTPVVVGSGYSGDGPRASVESVSQSTSTDLITINTSTAHGLVTGDTFRFSVVSDEVSGATISVSGTTEATVVDSNTITISLGEITQNFSTTPAVGYIQMVATADKKWIYATGNVKVYLGDVDVVNDNLGQGYDIAGNKNEIRLKAIRPAAVYFGTSIHLAVRVDLTA
jgi:hypothetical protein